MAPPRARLLYSDFKTRCERIGARWSDFTCVASLTRLGEWADGTELPRAVEDAVHARLKDLEAAHQPKHEEVPWWAD